jgi:hypothetical protein
VALNLRRNLATTFDAPALCQTLKSQTPLIDLRTLFPEAMETLAATYDAVCDQGLRPFSEMDADPVRERIDAAIGQALGLPDIAVLRRLLAREPVVCLRRL